VPALQALVAHLVGHPPWQRTPRTAVRKLVAKLSAKYDKLTFCYEAGPTGYWLYRLLKSLGRSARWSLPRSSRRSPANG